MRRRAGGMDRAVGETAGAEVLSPAAREQVQRTIAETAFGTERLICWGRLVFYAGLVLHFTWFALADGEVNWRRAALMVPTAVGIVFSASVLIWVRSAPRWSAYWLATVTIDAMAAFFGLAENALWPRPDYIGALATPDTAGILVAIIGAGFRLSIAAALWGGLVNTIGILALVQIDAATTGIAVNPERLVIYLLFMTASTILGTIIAHVTRSLALRGAVAALRVERAERGLGTVLADCHDARSALSAARLHADVLRSTASNQDPDLRALAIAGESLVEDLGVVERLVLDAKTRAVADLGALEQPLPVFLPPVVERALRQARVRFSGVVLEAPRTLPELRVLVAGGTVALHRVLLNLLCNACEGDGERVASTVSLHIEPDPDRGRVSLRIVDDGPGFPERSGENPSSKADGFGVGLNVVRGISEASGGQLTIRSRSGNGTAVSVEFPLAPAVESHG